jgi:hypothetical protein
VTQNKRLIPAAQTGFSARGEIAPGAVEWQARLMVSDAPISESRN